MNIAYIILAHKEPEQLIRLVNRLNPAQNSFFIHIDKKIEDAVYKKITASLGCFSNVYFLKRHQCFWGDFSIVKATIEGINTLIEQEIPFDWLILLSGQDYPIKSNTQIELFLKKHSDNLFIEYSALPTFEGDLDSENGGLDRIEYWYKNLILFNIPFRFTNKPMNCSLEFLIKRFKRFMKKDYLREFLIPAPFSFLFRRIRKFPKEFRPYYGSQWWCLSRDCIEYIYSFILDNSAFVRFFYCVNIPDEIFFQTIILNSPFQHKAINDKLRYIDWAVEREEPAILGKMDFENILESLSLFARKFDVSKDKEILDMIDQEILFK